ncbi:LTA synthase family protein, partial [Aminicella lysinilytica]|uniref:LTA synthase family protein n=1 Tax=Aminicella lysinilytica TaxID=433323 RepID=UPI0026EE66B1
WAFLINLFIETLARHDPPVLAGLKYMVTSPLVFLDNMLIIFATLCIATLFRRRMFVLALIISVWVSLGVANGIILLQRMTPFTMKDLSSMTDGATIVTNYLAKWQIILIAGAFAVVVIGFVILFLKGPKKPTKVNLKRNLAVVVLIICCAFGGTFGLIKANVMSTFFGNLAYAYQDYGVPYCFINTWLNTGIHKPSNYSKSAVQNIFKDSDYTGSNKTMTLKKTNEANTSEEPNILFLQLESFVDPELFTDVKYSQDPIPYYRSLMKKYSSGSLTVPACGAGTANTEFEVMTGLSVKFFGPGEYPFKSVLKDKAAESVATDLKSIGYSTHAIHNHRALFYNRNTVFKNLGYDTFTSVEYMSDVQKTPKGWAKDTILTSQITDALKSTKTKDYIYTISVQGHGKYPSEKMIANPKIKVTSAPDEETKNKYEYYVNQVYEMDKFVKKLTQTLSNYDEKVVLVMYGDHIPALDVTEDTYKAKNLYQTQYVIWSNYKMTKEDKDLYAYQLSADVLNRVGIHTGTTIKYHQDTNHSSKSYLKNLKLLGYDMLYGKDYIYGGSNPFKASKMKMGVKNIKIDKVVNVGGKYYIKGQNFTEYSKVTLDGKTLKTVYLSPNLLGLLSEADTNDASRMKVSQIDKTNDTIISTTE